MRAIYEKSKWSILFWLVLLTGCRGNYEKVNSMYQKIRGPWVEDSGMHRITLTAITPSYGAWEYFADAHLDILIQDMKSGRIRHFPYIHVEYKGGVLSMDIGPKWHKTHFKEGEKEEDCDSVGIGNRFSIIPRTNGNVGIDYGKGGVKEFLRQSANPEASSERGVAALEMAKAIERFYRSKEMVENHVWGLPLTHYPDFACDPTEGGLWEITFDNVLPSFENESSVVGAFRPGKKGKALLRILIDNLGDLTAKVKQVQIYECYEESSGKEVHWKMIWNRGGGERVLEDTATGMALREEYRLK